MGKLVRLYEVAIRRLKPDTRLYEVLLRFPDRDALRLTDQLPEVGDTLDADGESWEITRLEREPRHVFETAAFVCELRRSGQRPATRLAALRREMTGGSPSRSSPSRTSAAR